MAAFGTKKFHYPKPLSLLQGLISQASRPNDTILDFFAGSGTTGHAVLALNALDGGNRKFILCSSTEATEKEPDKNLCRDVCAARIQKVIESDAIHGGNSFAYLQLDKFAPAHVAFEASVEHAHALVALRESGAVSATWAVDSVQVVARGPGFAIIVCPKLTRAAIAAMGAISQAIGAAKLVVYCNRPDSAVQMLAQLGVPASAYAIADALLFGQGPKPRLAQPAPAPVQISMPIPALVSQAADQTITAPTSNPIAHPAGVSFA